HTQPARRAGFPTTSSWSWTSRVTTAPAPTMQYGPSVTPHTIVAFAPIDAPRPTWVGTIFQSVEVARGRRSFVKVALGPTNPSSAIVTPSNTETLFWIFPRSPPATPRSTKTFFPRTQLLPTDASVRTCA